MTTSAGPGTHKFHSFILKPKIFYETFKKYFRVFEKGKEMVQEGKREEGTVKLFCFI